MAKDEAVMLDEEFDNYNNARYASLVEVFGKEEADKIMANESDEVREEEIEDSDEEGETLD